MLRSLVLLALLTPTAGAPIGMPSSRHSGAAPDVLISVIKALIASFGGTKVMQAVQQLVEGGAAASHGRSSSAAATVERRSRRVAASSPPPRFNLTDASPSEVMPTRVMPARVRRSAAARASAAIVIARAWRARPRHVVSSRTNHIIGSYDYARRLRIADSITADSAAAARNRAATATEHARLPLAANDAADSARRQQTIAQAAKAGFAADGGLTGAPHVASTRIARFWRARCRMSAQEGGIASRPGAGALTEPPGASSSLASSCLASTEPAPIAITITRASIPIAQAATSIALITTDATASEAATISEGAIGAMSAPSEVASISEGAMDTESCVDIASAGRYIATRLAFRWHQRAIRSYMYQNSASPNIAMLRLEALEIALGRCELEEWDAEQWQDESTIRLLAYPSWLAQAVKQLSQSSLSADSNAPEDIQASAQPSHPEPSGQENARAEASTLSSPGRSDVELSSTPLFAAPAVVAPQGLPPPSLPCSPPEPSSPSDLNAPSPPAFVDHTLARASNAAFAAELAAALAAAQAVRSGATTLAPTQTRRSASHAADAKARAAAGRLLAAVPQRIWMLLCFAYKLRARAAASDTAQARRAAAKLSDCIHELRSSPPRPLTTYDVGLDRGMLLYRSELGVVSDAHPTHSSMSLIPSGHMLRADGTTQPPLLPPPDGPVRICPEVSGAICYYDDETGTAVWDAPTGSKAAGQSPIASVDQLRDGSGRQLGAFTSPPPMYPVGLGLASLRGTSWLPVFEDANHRVLLYHSETGSVREAPWISLRTSRGCVFFANLVTHQTRWMPPRRWMEGWIKRPSVSSEGLALNSLLEGTRYARDLLPVSLARQRIEGGAPYLWETGLPAYAPDEYDSALTHPQVPSIAGCG